MSHSRQTTDDNEIRQFSHLSQHWWDPSGPFRALHQINHLRLRAIRQLLTEHFTHLCSGEKPFQGLRMLDIGCGGGILSEPLSRLGASVTGIDASREAIAAAVQHARQEGLDITYESATAESLTQTHAGAFDVVFAMEIVEHLADRQLFFSACGQLLSKRGIFIFSTINRTAASFWQMIVAAEFLLRLVPVGTHSWRKFVTPHEADILCQHAGLHMKKTLGFEYKPFHSPSWVLSEKDHVNYMAHATHGERGSALSR